MGILNSPQAEIVLIVGKWWKRNEVWKRLTSGEARRRHRELKRRQRQEADATSELIALGRNKETKMQIDLGTRTSTNALVGGGIFSQLYVALVELIPGEGAVETLLMQPETVAFAAVLFATLVARISKTAEKPGAI